MDTDSHLKLLHFKDYPLSTYLIFSVRITNIYSQICVSECKKCLECFFFELLLVSPFLLKTVLNEENVA